MNAPTQHDNTLMSFCFCSLFSFLNKSFFNDKEVDVVIKQIQDLFKLKSIAGHTNVTVKEEDIGFVTPYRAQVKRIRDRCSQLGYKKITIGSAEIFQGKEKPVIIVSTVRTHQQLGFVSAAQVRLFSF